MGKVFVLFLIVYIVDQDNLILKGLGKLTWLLGGLVVEFMLILFEILGRFIMLLFRKLGIFITVMILTLSIFSIYNIPKLAEKYNNDFIEEDSHIKDSNDDTYVEDSYNQDNNDEAYIEDSYDQGLDIENMHPSSDQIRLDNANDNGYSDYVEPYQPEENNDPGTHWVNEYNRSDGTHVRGHERSNPDGDPTNNLIPKPW